MNLMHMSADVVIVGAGVAGLKAAMELQAAGKRVVVLEARSRVGGRAMRGIVAGVPVDFGGQWLGSEHDVFREQAENLGIRIYPQHTDGYDLIDVDGRVKSFNSELPRLPWPSLFGLGVAYQYLKSDLRRLHDERPMRAKNAAEFDRLSLAVWIDKKIHTDGARRMFRLIARAILCTEPSEVSYLFFLEVLRQGGGLASMVGIKGGAQQDKFVGGAWQVAKRMADQVIDSIVLEAPVYAIKQGEHSVQVYCAKGTFHASRAIVTAPPSLASRITFEPSLSAKRAGLLRRMPMGCVIKMHVAYPTPFWRERGLSGTVISADRALSMVFDQTPPEGGVGILVGLIEGAHAVELSDMGPVDRRKRVLDDLTHYFGEEGRAPLDYVDHDWIHEDWSEGGYGAYMPPGVMTAYADGIREPHGRVHWAGTETATEFGGYFEGAIRSGIRAANEIIALEQ